ncbi:MAG: chorismate-binding protein [Maribacter sp.]|uniref:chorismate-binding protein n=1 Tax=Maribacter sp. TaxID=1897614 RepID=UPI003296AFC1
MFSELLSSLVEHHKKELPFVAYRKPKEEIVKAIFQEDSQVHYVKDFSESGFVFAPFDSQHKAILLPNTTTLEAKYIPNKASDAMDKNSLVAIRSDKERHLNLVKKGISQIEQGKFKKVVLSRKLETTCKAEPTDLFQNLLNTYTNAFCYLWHHPQIGTWLGATPEILLKAENLQFTTMSLAGTRQYIETKSPEWGTKELDEQQLVTDYISKALVGVVSNLQTGERESVRAGNLWHLRTKLVGRMESGSLAKIIHALHPTPAICGMPMKATKNFILENENYNRDYYTGFLGELNFITGKDRSSNSRNQEHKAYRSVKNTSTLFVNLRCMKLENAIAHIYVGGGVTRDSEPEKEWKETVAKSNTILQALIEA